MSHLRLGQVVRFYIFELLNDHAASRSRIHDLQTAKRASFHDAPDARSVRKAYLVAGDVVYVQEERPGWYRVRYTHARRESAGSITKSDTFEWRQYPK